MTPIKCRLAWLGSVPALLAAVLLCSGCALLQDHHKRRISTAEKRFMDQHAAFRAQPGWRKLTYRQPDLMARANAQNSAVEIALREQRGLLLVDGAIAMDFPVATGKASHPTTKGSYKVVDKKKDYCSNLYGKIVSATGETVVSDADTREDAVPEGGSFVGARMPYWMRITPTGLGMHVGYVPGNRPASHGCIRLKKDVAVELFNIVGMGTPVTVESFAPVLGGPVGLESVVIGEVAEQPPRPHPGPKPISTPTPTPAPASFPAQDATAAPTPAPSPETSPAI